MFKEKMNEYGFNKKKGFNYVFEDDGIKIDVFKNYGQIYVVIYDKEFEETEIKKPESIDELISILDMMLEC